MKSLKEYGDSIIESVKTGIEQINQALKQELQNQLSSFMTNKINEAEKEFLEKSYIYWKDCKLEIEKNEKNYKGQLGMEKILERANNSAKKRLESKMRTLIASYQVLINNYKSQMR